MIARLKGIVDGICEDTLILDVNGVGYKVFVSSRILQAVRLGDAITLDIETVIREDTFNLFGFLNADDKQWFDVLTSVQGVGAKFALAIQSVLNCNDLYVAVGSGDKNAFIRANGIGPKLAGRIVLELKDKVAKMGIVGTSLSANVDEFSAQTGENKISMDGGETMVMEEAVSALMNLGFSRSQGFTAVSKSVEQLNGDITLEGIIQLALKELN